MSQSYEKFIKNKTSLSENDYIYVYNTEESLSFDQIDEELKLANSANAKMKYLNKISDNQNKNRFVHKLTKKLFK